MGATDSGYEIVLERSPWPNVLSLGHNRCHATEFNLNTGRVNTWMECYDQSGIVNRVHLKQINGQDLISPHYPPTARELGLHE